MPGDFATPRTAQDELPGEPPAALLERWGLTFDGQGWRGYMSRVWAVRGPQAQRWTLKLTDAHHPPTGELAALLVWRSHRVPVVDVIDAHDGAMLLQRLDGDRTLESHPDADDADRTIGLRLGQLAGLPAPPGTPTLLAEVERQLDAIGDNLATAPDVLPRRQVEQAVATLSDLAADLRDLPDDELTLLHYDLHYLNLLHTLPGDLPDWVVIDPLPKAGTPEVEVVAALRNRFADAQATGDADQALRRRLAVIAEPAGIDRERAGAIAQAVAVDNLLYLVPRNPGSQFVPPYTVLARW